MNIYKCNRCGEFAVLGRHVCSSDKELIRLQAEVHEKNADLVKACLLIAKMTEVVTEMKNGLEWIARVNATDAEYQAKAREVLQISEQKAA